MGLKGRRVKTPAHLEAIWAERMKGLFDPHDGAVVLEWLSRNWRRPRVVVVGSGFTRNAICRGSKRIPLWKELSDAIRRDLGLKDDSFDALQLPDIYAAERGRDRLRELLAQQLNDDELEPGLCHDALWLSDPAAIITTNFLDTVLEKSRPRRAQIVVRDPDLGQPIAEHRRHVIYLHGHRRHPATWVAGRQEYEQLPVDRPMIHAKVRQLLAEYPALIVGYSLNDPDFHFIYGDTLRAMREGRPRGLALSLRAAEAPRASKVNAHVLNQRYWRTLGLDLVRFSAQASRKPDQAYARFFELTAQVTTLSQLLPALQRPGKTIPTGQAFERNVSVGASALKDEHLADVLVHPYHRRQWWSEVLAYSLDATAQESARKAVIDTNLRRHPSRPAQEGERRKLRGVAAVPIPINRDAWVLGSARWRQSESAARLLDMLDGGNEAVRHVEQLLVAGAKRTTTRDWLKLAISDSEQPTGPAERSLVVAFALMSDGDQQQLGEAFRVARKRSEDTVSEAIRLYLRHVPRRVSRVPRSKAIVSLQRAFRLVTNGRLVKAAKEYRRIMDDGLRAEGADADPNKALLLYFAARGRLECTTWRTPIPEIEKLQRNCDRLEQEPAVRRWRERARVLEEGVLQSKAKHRGRPGYETRSGGWSASPGELWHQYERSTLLGASPGVRRDLLTPLLDALPQAEYELQERLALRIKDTGEWLRRAVEEGAFAVDRSSFFTESPKLGARQRAGAGSAVSRQLFGVVGAKLDKFSKLERAARVDVLGSFPEVLQAKDIKKCVRLVKAASGRWSFSEETVRTWVKLSHVCSWSTVRQVFSSIAGRMTNDSRLQREILWGGGSLPWEHWSECDHFWDKGGLPLLRSLVQTEDRVLAGRVGWLLGSLLDTAPRTAVHELSRQWLIRAELDLSDRDTLAAAVSLLAALPPKVARAPSVMRAAKLNPTCEILVNVLQSRQRGSMRVWAEAEIDRWVDRRGWQEQKQFRSLGSRDDVAEAHCLVSVIKRSGERREVCVARLLELFDITWDTLAAIGEILQPTYWPGRWGSLLQILRVGGHARVANSWLLARLRLTLDALNAGGKGRRCLLESSELAFLRSGVVDAIAHGDAILANNAVYVLPALARWTRDPGEVAAIRAALVAASDDIRIGVAHGAAFTTGYIEAISRYETLPSELVVLARRLAARHATDNLAVIRRQLEFGRAKGTLHGEQAQAR